MKRIAYITALLIAMTFMSGCSDQYNDAWDALPETIAEFVSRYYPEAAVKKYVEDDGQYYVSIKNGAEIIFNSDYQWTSLNGRGGTLPQIFLFDELPPTLYSYLQETEEVDDVYTVSRDAAGYKVKTNSEIISYSNTGIISTEPAEI